MYQGMRRTAMTNPHARRLSDAADRDASAAVDLRFVASAGPSDLLRTNRVLGAVLWIALLIVLLRLSF
jgi:hypothetical protein